MDIQKELESFKVVAQSKVWNIDGETTKENYRFYCLTTQSGWEMWQAAKAQDIEGFVLVPREPTEIMAFRGESVLFDVFAENAIRIYKAMIEAQEQN